MSYNISFKVKVEGSDLYAPVGGCEANITWNVRDIICRSTGLEWKNEENNGLCLDVIPFIKRGIEELEHNGSHYKKYEDQDGWGTVEGTVDFFKQVLEDWRIFCILHDDLVPYAVFWIE